ncbi:MAG: dihydrodipicolinate synthase family protein [Halobacteriaceae archaeon]
MTAAGLRDAITGIVTPFDDDLNVDHAALAANVRALSGRGVDSFFVCSNVSEYHSLSPDERVAVTETSIDALPDDATTLAGAGGSTAAAIDFATTAESLGADYVMVMPPHHTYRHEGGLLDYYRRIGAAVDVPLVPYLRGFRPDASFVADLSRLDCVAGIKWTIPDVPLFAEAVEKGGDVVWINGLGELHAVSLYAEGARGMATGVGNVWPAVGRALYDALECGDFERAREIRDAVAPFMRFRHEAGEGNSLGHANSIPALKVALERAGLAGGPVREPLVDLSAAGRARAESLSDDVAAFVDAELSADPR